MFFIDNENNSRETIINYHGNQPEILKLTEQVNDQLSGLIKSKNFEDIYNHAKSAHVKIHELINKAHTLDKNWFSTNKVLLILITRDLTKLQEDCYEGKEKHEHHFIQFSIKYNNSTKKITLWKEFNNKNILDYSGENKELSILINRFNNLFINMQKLKIANLYNRQDLIFRDLDDGEKLLLKVLRVCLETETEWLADTRQAIENIISYFSKISSQENAQLIEIRQLLDNRQGVLSVIMKTEGSPCMFKSGDRQLVPYEKNKLQLMILDFEVNSELLSYAKFLASSWLKDYEVCRKEDFYEDIKQIENEGDLNAIEKELLELLKQPLGNQIEEELNETEKLLLRIL